MEWHDNSCGCGAPDPLDLFSTIDFECRPSAIGVIAQCANCGSIFPRRFPTRATIGQAYQRYYTTATRRRGWRSVERLIIDLFRQDYQRRALPRAARDVLDYGCGSGAYLASVTSASRFGTDVRRVIGPFQWIDLDAFPTDARRFDWITLGHVIEHLADPSGALKSIVAHLRPGGGIWIATPNAHSFLIKAFGGWARDIDFPRHREIYARSALEALLRRQGLAVRFVRPPRVNAVLNYVACARLLVGDGTAPKRWLTLMRATIALIAHVAWPKMEDAPELVAIATSEAWGRSESPAPNSDKATNRPNSQPIAQTGSERASAGEQGKAGSPSPG